MHFGVLPVAFVPRCIEIFESTFACELAFDKITFIGSLAAHVKLTISFKFSTEGISSKTITINKNVFDIRARNDAILPSSFIFVSVGISLDPISFF